MPVGGHVCRSEGGGGMCVGQRGGGHVCRSEGGEGQSVCELERGQGVRKQRNACCVWSELCVCVWEAFGVQAEGHVECVCIVCVHVVCVWCM